MQKTSVAYLSCPYTHPDPRVQKMRLCAANWVAYDLFKNGVYVYSPLTHNIPINNLGVHGNWVTWKDFDHSMVARCDRLIILKLPGWEVSKGVAAEVECAKQLGLPIEEMPFDEEKIKIASDMSLHPLGEIFSHLQVFINERDWSKFHSPKNLAMNMGVETGELMEHFRWLNEEESYVTDQAHLEEIKDEIGDVFLTLVQLAHKLNIDPVQALQDKLIKIAKKYPAEYAKGSCAKYTSYADYNKN